MGSKKRSIEDENEDIKPKNESELEKDKLNPMERRKKRKEMDKKKHQAENPAKNEAVPIIIDENMSTDETNNLPQFHIDVFRDLASVDASVRKSAAEKLSSELTVVQKKFEKTGCKKMEGEDAVMLEAEKDDGLENCAESLRYAIRRLIRGVSSPRECARQGFALGLSVLLAHIPAIKLESVMKLIVSLLEISGSMSGQEAKDCFLGRLFAYGSIATSGRLTSEWSENKDTSSITNFVSCLVSLAGKKQYLREPSFTIILNVAEQLPLEAMTKHVLEAPGIKECFEKAANVGDTDALFLALKLQEKFSIDNEIIGKLLPSPFSPDNLFSRDHLLSISACFKESTFCHPRLHSIWQLLVNILVQTLTSQDEGTHTKKNKKTRKGSLSEDTTKCIRSFCEVIESTLLFSSHERKHLALMILLLIFPHLPPSCVPIVLSSKFVQCLTDILAAKNSNLHETGLYFMKELNDWIGNNDERRVSVIVALQKHSNGRFDIITRTQTVKGLITKFDTTQGCLLLVQNLVLLFLDDVILSDAPSDQSQADENTEVGSLEEKGYPGAYDTLKTWIVDIMPRVLKNLKLKSNVKSLADTEIVKIIEEKFRIQAEIMKFLAVQGLFTASLGIEVTSFELGEKFKWPKSAISSSQCKMCIQQLQLLLEDAQKGEVSNASSNSLEKNDLGSYFMCFLKTLCNIPSLSIYRPLSEKDQEAFEKLQEAESRLFQEERKHDSGSEEAQKLHTLRYVLIHLVLQVLLCSDEFNEASLEIVLCCKKVFPKAFSASLDGELSPTASIDDESFPSATIDGEAGEMINEMPELMDVLSETFLSILPHSSGPMCFAIEQVYRLFSNDVTTDGILRMVRVITEDLKPLRHVTYSSDEEDDDDDDVFGIEDVDDAKATDTNDGLVNAENAEGKLGRVAKSEEVDSGEMVEEDSSSENEEAQDDNNESDSDDDMDDDEMLKRDAGIAEILKQKLSSGGKDKTYSQLLTFKSRVLTLLEIFLQKHPGKSQVLMIYSYLVRAFMKYNADQNTQLQQLAMRIKGILQKKIFKAKVCPKGDDILLTSLEPLLEKSLRSASRAPNKSIKSESRARNYETSSLAQASTFWLLKVIQSRNFDKKQLKKVIKLFKGTLTDYFESRKWKLKTEFIKEVLRRHPWIGKQLFGFLLKIFADVKSEFKKTEVAEILETVIKSWSLIQKLEEAAKKSTIKLLKKNMMSLCDFIYASLSDLPKKPARRKEVRLLCIRAVEIIVALNLKKQFQESLKPEAFPLCEAHLGDAFLPFGKNSH